MNDTRPDYERFERRQLIQEQDHRRVKTADVDESRAWKDGAGPQSRYIVIAVPENWYLIHRPSGEHFNSNTALAHFHRGWEAATEE
jgi:hypothetical protein